MDPQDWEFLDILVVACMLLLALKSLLVVLE